MKKLFRNHWGRWAIVALLSLTLLAAIGIIQTARALEVDKDGVIEAGEVIEDDVYIEADRVVVDGTVNGALIVSSNKAEINGTVNGDLVIFSSQAQVNGRVTGNLVFAGRQLSMNGSVGNSVFAVGSTAILESAAVAERNLVFGGFSLEMVEGSTVGRDLHVGSYQAILAGQVGRDVIVSTGALEIAGSVGGDVTAEVSEPEQDSQSVFQFMRWPGMPDE